MKASIYILLLLFAVPVFGQLHATKHYKSFNEFYERISNNRSLKLTNLSLTDTFTQRKKIAKDSIRETFSVKFADANLKFVTTRRTTNIGSYDDPSYIICNNQKIIPDSDSRFEGLAVTDAAKAVLHGTTFLFLSSWAPGCSGSFCRLEYNQLFQIKGKSVKYQIVEGWQFPTNIFCDLNNDGQLDMISFVGNCFSKNDSLENNNPGKFYFCIQALTLKNDKWVAMKDIHNRPYYIYLQADDFFELDKFKIIDYNWMIEL